MDLSESSDEEEMEELPRCIVSDLAQPHNFTRRAVEKIKHDCTWCGKSELYNSIHYYCTICDLECHSKCLERPSKLIHPYHPQHPLVFTVLDVETGIIANTSYFIFSRLFNGYNRKKSEHPNIILFDICTWCGNDLKQWFYRCKICNFCLDLNCATKCPPLTIQDPKSHHHSLALFPRPLSFPCNACGLIDVLDPSYACYQCNYVVHQSCIDLPRVIKIARHPHQLLHSPYLPPKVVRCRICYKNVDIKYGQFSCIHDDCSYVAHSTCATHEKIWDGVELEWENEESDDDAEDIAPYKKIGGGLIEHCWHENHYLKLEKYDDTRDLMKQCQACMRSITSQDFYSCIECDFFLHEVCANLPRKLNHALHKHALFMEPFSIDSQTISMLTCSACNRLSSGMKYICRTEGCMEMKMKPFRVDVNCILVPECSTHESHADPDHSLFISTFLHKENSQKRSCKGCKKEVDGYHLECVSCEFAICYICATIPHEIYHKYDEDPLTLCYGEDGVDDTYWCEVCESRLDPQEWFYMNSKSCTTIHRSCLFGDFAYLKPCSIHEDNEVIEVVRNDSSSRPICQICHLRCSQKLFFNWHSPDGAEVFLCTVHWTSPG